MHRWSHSAAVLVASWLVWLPGSSAAPPAETEALSRARALLERGEARPAVPLLENALPTVSPTDRPALLDLLRRAYDLAARQAEAAGQGDEAAEYRDNLEILNRRHRRKTAPAPAAATPPEPAPRPSPVAAAGSPLDLAVTRASAVAVAEGASLPKP